METKPHDNAFACEYSDKTYWENGLTKREYFAAMAVQGILASNKSGFCDVFHDVYMAVKYADNLIDELNKKALEEKVK